MNLKEQKEQVQSVFKKLNREKVSKDNRLKYFIQHLNLYSAVFSILRKDLQMFKVI